MKFGAVPVARAEGAISAHSVRHSQGVIRKGQVLLAKDIEVLANSGIREIVVARLEKGDVHEDKAATLLAEALGGAEHVAGRAQRERLCIPVHEDGEVGASVREHVRQLGQGHVARHDGHVRVRQYGGHGVPLDDRRPTRDHRWFRPKSPRPSQRKQRRQRAILGLTQDQLGVAGGAVKRHLDVVHAAGIDADVGDADPGVARFHHALVDLNLLAPLAVAQHAADVTPGFVEAIVNIVTKAIGLP